ncbi:FAST kinase domain-containing protein 4 isoform X2 [Rousettus aegyptiacus]|uniref:Transforming growth factor beta regulator 4 n=1 Tax=Rousettus aegyptiacus TaxID=9407 RepID=A0A7J8D998_ROUAE|nr:FAST kinase domain-containing protein 4 isoform X2 [Rousettus aegyptiacus]KAF6419539.1 transforming growth factor beta regulator 4 [Rousettus aegyptiacus]
MAARLVKRCTCLLRQATRLAPAGPPVGQLRLAGVAQKTLTSSATSPSSLSQHVEKGQVFTPSPERQEVDELIEKATQPEELLGLLEGGHSLSQGHAALVLIQLSRLLSERPADKASLTQDVRFQQLLHLVNSQITAVWHGTLVKLLRSLYTLALPATSKELRSVEQEVRWRLRRLRYKHLAFLAESSAAHMQERGSQELLAELLLHLERRWAEIEDGRTLVTIMMRTGHLSEPLMNRLEDKCLELVEQFGPDDLRKVLVALAAQNRRSVPLLRAISYHLVQKPFPLTKGVLLDLAYAYDAGVPALGRRPAAPRAQPHARRGGSLRQVLRLPQVAQPASVRGLCPAHPEQRPGRRLATPVQHAAGLRPPQLPPRAGGPLLRPGAREAGAGAGQPGPRPAGGRAVGPVRAAAGAGGPTPGRAAPRVSPSVPSGSPKDQSTFQKLLHINSTARLEHPTYTGPLLPASALGPQPSADRKVTPFQKELQETLKGLLGGSDRGSFEVATQFGWVLDAEVLLDADGQFLPLRDFVAPHLTVPSGSQPLPPRAKRLAFLRWEFPNFNSRSKELLGRFVMARRHVLAAGFLVVDVPYYEWSELKSEWQKGAYLKDKVRKAVAEELAK